MVSASDKLTIELQWREAVTVYGRRLLQMFYIALANVLLLGVVVVLGLTVGLAAVAAAFAAIGSAIGALVVAVLTGLGTIIVAIVTGVAGWLIEHWLLSLMILLVTVFLLAAFGSSERR